MAIWWAETNEGLCTSNGIVVGCRSPSSAWFSRGFEYTPRFISTLSTVAHYSLSVPQSSRLDEQSSSHRSCPTQTISRVIVVEVSRRPNRTCAVGADNDSVTFPAVGPESLVRLAEESSQIYSILLRLNPSYGDVAADREYISSISGLIPRDVTSPTRLSSAEAAVLTETYYQVLSPRYIFPSLSVLADRLNGT